MYDVPDEDLDEDDTFNVKIDDVDDLIISMKKNDHTYKEIGEEISKKFSDEKRNKRNLIYKVWRRYREDHERVKAEERNSRAKSQPSDTILKPSHSREMFGKVETSKNRTMNNPLKAIPETPTIPTQTCAHCGGSIVEDEIRGESACRKCGLVCDMKKIDTGPEWRYFDSSDEGKIRTGGPKSWSLFDTGLSTDFFPYGSDGKGAQLSAKNRANFRRWRKWHNRNKISDSNQRNLSIAFNELDKMCSQLRIPRSFKEETALLYRRLRNNELTSGRSINGLITACLYVICRIHKLPCTEEEILVSAPVTDASEFRSCFKRVCDHAEELDIAIPTTKATDYIAKYASALDIQANAANAARKLVKLVGNTRTSVGRNPKGITAAALYIIGKINGFENSQKDFSNVCQVTEVTIRQRTKEIVKQLKLYERYPSQFPPKRYAPSNRA
jgi:transcription initiation factor TFIIB